MASMLEQILAGQPLVEITKPQKRMPAAATTQPVRQMMENRSEALDPRYSALDKLFGEQEKTAQDLAAYADKLQNPEPKVDLRTLGAIVDMWTGSDVARSLPANMTPDERDAQVAKVRALANEAQTGLAKQQIDLIKARETDDRSILRTILAANKTGAEDIRAQNLMFQKEKTLESQLQKEIGAPLEERTEQLRSLSDAFSRNDYASTISGLANFARAVVGEKGVLTDEDIKRTFPANMNMTWAKLKTYFSDENTANIDPKLTQNLRELVEAAKARTVERFKSQLGTKRKNYKGMNAYRGLMDPGGSGDQMFFNFEERLNELAPPKKEEKAGPQYEGKAVNKFQYSKDGKRTKIVFKDGSEKVVDGIVK